MASEQLPEDIPVVADPLELYLDEQERVIVGRGGDLHTAHPDEGLAFIGRIFEQTPDGTSSYTLKPVFLDIAQPHRVFISGKSGSGKSYTLGVIIEEIQKAQMGVACVVVDIMGVFTASKEPNHDLKENIALLQWNLDAKGIIGAKIFVPTGHADQVPRHLWDESFSFKPDDLELDDWLYVLNINFNSAMGLCLSETLNVLHQEHLDGYSVADIISTLQTAPQITNPEKGFAASSRKALSSKLQATQNWGLFSTQGTPLSSICQANTCAILDVSALNENLRALVTGILARKILETRRQIARGGDVSEENSIPITWLVVDEAHNFAPAKGSTPALEALVRLAKEGRHPGANLVLATQQPGATSSDIISQCDVLITHNLSYDEDIKTFKAKAPCEIPKSMLDSKFIRSLAVGVAILAIQSMRISRAFVVQIRPRQSQHGGQELLPAAFISPKEEVPGESPPAEVDQERNITEDMNEQPEENVVFKSEAEFFPSNLETPDSLAIEIPQSSSTGDQIPDLTGGAILNLPEELAMDVLGRALTYDPFFPKGGSFEEERERFYTTPETFFAKSTKTLQNGNYTVTYKTHESGAWLLLAEHAEAEHEIFLAAAMVGEELYVAFQASLPPRNPPQGTITLKKLLSILGTDI